MFVINVGVSIVSHLGASYGVLSVAGLNLGGMNLNAPSKFHIVELAVS